MFISFDLSGTIIKTKNLNCQYHFKAKKRGLENYFGGSMFLRKRMVIFLSCFVLFLYTNSYSNILLMFKDDNFVKQLELNNNQKEKMEQIFKIEEKQAILDRENFGFSAESMREANKRRMHMVESMFTDMLTQIQQKTYIELKNEWIVVYDNLTFRKIMDFTKAQKLQIDEIINKYEIKEQREKEMYRRVASKLISSASDRKFFLDTAIEKILTEEQEKEYEIIKLKRDSDVEFFTFKEGLLLNESQFFEVKNILNSIREQREHKRKDSYSNKESKKKGRGKGKTTGDKFYQLKQILHSFQIKLLEQLVGNKDKKNKPRSRGNNAGMGKGGGRRMH